MSEAEPKVLSLMPWDIAVRNATQRKSPRALLERNDADEIIRGMSELEVYYALRALGVDDSVPFLAVLEPEQITALFDLEIWHQEQPNFSDLFAWLEGFKEAGLARLQLAVRTLDVELTAAALRERLHIAIKPTDDDLDHEIPEWVRFAPEEIMPIVETPDRTYLIAARATNEMTGETFDEEERKAVLRLIDDLYRDEDFSGVSRLLHVAAHDLSSDLEEGSLRFRNARLEDLGFPPRERALAVYGPVDVERVLKSEDEPRAPSELKLPATLLEPYAEGFFEDVLASLENPDLVRSVEGELVTLSNAALVADGVEPGNLEGIRSVLERARGYLELALSHGASASERLDVARQRLETHPLRSLFGVGYTLVLRVAGRARAVEKSLARIHALRFVEESDQALLRALKRPRALFVAEGADLDAIEPFRAPEQLLSANRRLDELEALGRLATSCRFVELYTSAPEGALPPLEEWSFEHMLATQLAREALGLPLSPLEPLDSKQLASLSKGIEGPLGTKLPETEREVLLTRVRRLSERLLAISGAPTDPRFMDPLIRRG